MVRQPAFVSAAFFLYFCGVMANIVEIESLEQIGIEVYASLTEAQLRDALNPERGIFIAESPKVIDVALRAGYEPLSLLCERRHIKGDAAAIVERLGDCPVYTGDRALLEKLTGYRLTRGVLCAMRRRKEPDLKSVVEGAKRVCVIDSVCDTTNIGAIFRSAAALGVDAVCLTRGSCDPLNRRAIRVSMGSVFLVPWTWVDDASDLKEFGFKTVALALTDRSLPIDAEELKMEDKLAMVVGTEGDGLPESVISAADYTVRIPMFHGVDSLNVAAASAVAFWELRRKK